MLRAYHYVWEKFIINREDKDMQKIGVVTDSHGGISIQEAEKLGIKIITEQELVDMIGGEHTQPTAQAEVAAPEPKREEPMQGVLF